MKKICLILFASAICLSAGTAIAYYNTSSLGYDDTDMLSVKDGVITIMNIDINYIYLKQYIERAAEETGKHFMPI